MRVYKIRMNIIQTSTVISYDCHITYWIAFYSHVTIAVQLIGNF
jgi:hypothetical protein